MARLMAFIIVISPVLVHYDFVMAATRIIGNVGNAFAFDLSQVDVSHELYLHRANNPGLDAYRFGVASTDDARHLGHLVISDDLIDWEIVSPRLRSVTYGNGIILAIDDEGRLVYTTPPLQPPVSWRHIELPGLYYDVFNISFQSGVFRLTYGVMNEWGGTDIPHFMISSDGHNWFDYGDRRFSILPDGQALISLGVDEDGVFRAYTAPALVENAYWSEIYYREGPFRPYPGHTIFTNGHIMVSLTFLPPPPPTPSPDGLPTRPNPATSIALVTTDLETWHETTWGGDVPGFDWDAPTIHTIEAVAGDRGPVEDMTFTHWNDDENRWRLSAYITLSGSAPHRTNIIPPRAISILYGSISGRFTIPNPTRHITVELRQNNATGVIISTATIPPPANIQTQAEFHFSNILPGTYSLIFHKRGHTTVTVNNIIVEAETDTDISQDPRFPAQLPMYPGNASGNGQINVLDLDILLQNWVGDYIDANFTASGQVNIEDLSLMLLHWAAEDTIIE